MTPRDDNNMTDMTDAEIDANYSGSPWDPFSWNQYYLGAMQKGTSKKGNQMHTLRFNAVQSDEAIFHNINYDADGKMMFASQHNKILNALVQGKEKTVAEAIRKAKGNRKITIWIKMEMNGNYMNIGQVKQSLTSEDQMNDVLAKSVEKGKPNDDDDLPT